jgi:hypothetical protein
MAWLIGDGFDFYNAAADEILPGTIWAAQNAGPSTTTRFGAGLSLSFGGTSSISSIVFGNSTTIWVNFAYEITGGFTASGTTQGFGFQLIDGSSNQLGVFLRNGGDFVVTAGTLGGAVLATSPVIYSGTGLWHHLQFKIVINNTTGSVELRVDGNTSNDWTATGLNTRNGTINSQVNKFAIPSVSTVSGLMDDFYVFNDQGVAPNTWQGDVRAIQLMPTSDSSVTWTANSGANNFSRVAENRQDGDTSYVSTSVVNNNDKYGTASLSTTPLAIVGVQTKMLARMDDAGPHTVKSRLTSGSTNADSANLTCASNYQWIWQINTIDPNTAAAWTASAVNAATIGPFDVL